MTSLAADRLYALLPAIYRIRDQAQGEPLRALIGLVAKEFQALEENVEQLYDDQFIETCADWVAPYIGDLIGYQPLHGVTPRIASPRAEVAHTIAYRRRKGTHRPQVQGRIASANRAGRHAADSIWQTGFT